MNSEVKEMYIEQNETQYPCTGYKGGIDVRLTLPDKPTLTGTVTLCTDDGFVLRVISCGDYARQVWVGDMLTLTNAPEPEPPEDPPSETDTITMDDLAEQVFDLEVRTTMIEQGVN